MEEEGSRSGWMKNRKRIEKEKGNKGGKGEENKIIILRLASRSWLSRLSIRSCWPLLLPVLQTQVLCPWRLCRDTCETWFLWSTGGAAIAGYQILLVLLHGSSVQQRLLSNVLLLLLLGAGHHRSVPLLDVENKKRGGKTERDKRQMKNVIMEGWMENM